MFACPLSGDDRLAVAWVKQHAIAVKAVQAEQGFDDLQPLKALVGDARIVSLGESTHGSREIFQLKHRLVEFLATEMGFSIFGIEANMPESYRINDYVVGGAGDPAALIGGMYFWTWNTEEVLEMVQWMRRFNAGKPRVQFTGFDMQTPPVAAALVLDFLAKSDANLFLAARAAYAPLDHMRPQPQAAFGVATSTFPVAAARNRKVTFSGWIKTEGIRDGFAGLWWRADAADGKVLAFDNMAAQRVAGSRDWQRYSIQLAMPREVANINFGALLTGNAGKAWFDDLQVTLDEQPYANVELFDFGFESNPPRGFGVLQLARVDEMVAKVGQRSLCIELGATTARANGPRPEAVVAECRKVVERMRAARDAWVKSQPAANVDWAIQNARVVAQCAEMMAGDFAVRDRAMADNVAWILEQNPGAKIVLWAHNGHVAKRPFAMGKYLDAKFGARHLAVAFSTSQGAYQAIGSAGLGEHRLADPAAGSIEAVFRQAGLPRFIVDLRTIQPGTPESGWLAQPHPFRSIGAVAQEQQFFPVLLSREFDAVVHIETTSRARPLRASAARTQ
jgi:erythromycin esterase-like protein